MTGPDRLRPPLARGGLDRAADEREVPELVESARRDAGTRVLVLHGDAAPLARPDALRYVSPAEAPADAHWALLGRRAPAHDGGEDHAPAAPAGAVVLLAAVPRDADEPFPAPAGWVGLRAVGADLSPEDAGVFVEALSLGRWLRDAPFCPACGARTELGRAGWSRHCPSCGREHFPRTDPAVIVAVTSAADPDLLLLGSNATWGGSRFSCFAGFVEAGEALEATIAREVREEAGVEVTGMRYRGSQAWPYPRSLMIGFTATALDDDAARADGEEIAEVRWFRRAEIGEALAGRGAFALPGEASIAHRLISDWHGERP